MRIAILGRAINRRTGNEGICACTGDFGDVVDFDTTIDFQPYTAPALTLVSIDACPFRL